jgi:transcriptional regulator with XRE-family HTH domain
MALEGKMNIPMGMIIAGLRKTKKIRQSELADRTGLKQPSLSRIEKGLVEPRRSTLEKICSALHYSI